MQKWMQSVPVSKESVTDNVIRKQSCSFSDLKLPADFAVYAVGIGNISGNPKIEVQSDKTGQSSGVRVDISGEPIGQKLAYPIDQSGYEATQMDIVVNSPNKPVILMLGAYNPTIWNISWTPETKILAVLAGGYHRQAVAGLEKNTDLNVCERFYVHDNSDDIESLNPIARRYFEHPVDTIYFADSKQVVIGEPIPKGTKLLTSTEITPESFYDKSAPLAGNVGIEDAVRKGFLRKATVADAEAWASAVIQNTPNLDLPPIMGRGVLVPKPPIYKDSYVLLKPFTYPSGASAILLIPKGIQKPEGKNLGGATIYDFNTLTCTGGLCNSEFEIALKKDVMQKPSCKFSGLKFPAEFSVFAAGNYEGRPLGFQIDQSGAEATQMDVVVNSPIKPVVLMLGTYYPTIWNISWTQKTKILAVLVSGYHRQVIAGLEKNTHSLISTIDHGECGYFYITPNPADIVPLNPFARHIFGQSVDMVYLVEKGKVVVGEPLSTGEKLVTSSRISPKSFYKKSAPLAGFAGVEEAVRKGLLREATSSDVEAWVDAIIKNSPKSDIPNIAGRGIPKPSMPPAGKGSYVYVVLKSFTYPAGLSSFPVRFLIPKGVPKPKGDSYPATVYDFNTLTCEGTLC